MSKAYQTSTSVAKEFALHWTVHGLSPLTKCYKSTGFRVRVMAYSILSTGRIGREGATDFRLCTQISHFVPMKRPKDRPHTKNWLACTKTETSFQGLYFHSTRACCGEMITLYGDVRSRAGLGGEAATLSWESEPQQNVTPNHSVLLVIHE